MFCSKISSKDEKSIVLKLAHLGFVHFDCAFGQEVFKKTKATLNSTFYGAIIMEIKILTMRLNLNIKVLPYNQANWSDETP